MFLYDIESMEETPVFLTIVFVGQGVCVPGASDGAKDEAGGVLF